MKKTILLPMILLLMFAQQSYAQHHNDEAKEQVKDEVSENGIQWAKDMTQKVDQICGLTGEQKKEILEVNLKFANRVEEIREDKSLSAEDKEKHKSKLIETVVSEYGPILTSDQKSKLKQHWEELKD